MLPRLAVRAVLIENGKILLAQYRKKGEEWYVVPGGGVEEGENLEEAFSRETQEECGSKMEMKELLFIREIMADRHETNLPKGFHQVELYFRAYRREGVELKMVSPDDNQVGLEWIPLSALNSVTFFPRGMTEVFMNESWPRDYAGEMR